MAFTRIHHVGMVNADFEEARHVLVDGFGLSVDEHRSPWPDGRPGDYDGVTTVEFPIGEMYYEIAKPGDSDSGAAQFLSSTNGRGGIYFISIASSDIANDVQRLTQNGVRVDGDWDGEGPVFLDPATCLGLKFQITPEDHYYAHPYLRGNGNVTGMAHIGIAARSADEIRHLWGDVFGLPEDPSTERGQSRTGEGSNRPAGDPVHLIEFPLGGTVIEISVPLSDDSGTARLVAQRAPLGAVYHHTCPHTPDVHRFMDQAEAAGLQQIGQIPPRGERDMVVGWLHPRSCLGMLIEVWNRRPGEGHYHPPVEVD